MMGKQQDQPKLFYYAEAVNLSKRVRRENPLRAIKAGVDFSFVRSEVASCYGHNGNELRRGVAAAPPLVDPEAILKMMFLLFYDNVASERELMRIIPERLDYQWFLGYGLDDPVPDPSVLSKARRRWGREVFERLFVRTVQQAVALGLVEGRKIHMDSSLIQADASKDSVRKGSPKLMAVLKRLYQKQEEKLEERAQILAAEAPSVEPAGAGGAPEGAASSGAGDPPGQSAGEPEKAQRYERVNEGLMSTTDPDAAVVRKGRGEARPRYKSHRSVDDAHGVITAVKSTPGDVDEGREWVGLLEQHERHTQKKVGAVVADRKYGTTQNFRECFQRGVRSHMADLSASQQDTGRRKDIFTENDFVYDPPTDTYRCPAGQTLTRRRHHKNRQAYEYLAPDKVCQACAMKSQCTRSHGARSLKRHEDHEAIQAARAESASREAKRDRRRRRHLMEGRFADAANNHHFKRSRWRGLIPQEMQDLLIAAIQNIRILLQHTRRSTQGIHAGIKVGLGSLPSFVLSLYGVLTCWASRFRPRRACFGHFGP
jgi:transposase